jgi:molybdenum cofactor biosynthesis protein MoaC
MIDVSPKPDSLRTATARAILRGHPDAFTHLRERTLPKGDALEVARAAAALAVKQTPQMIPYCHPIRVDLVDTQFEIGADSVTIDVTVRAVDRTGVEVEAMTGAAVAALTIYDMMKMIDDTLSIDTVRLLEKRGGKSDHRVDMAAAKFVAAVLVASDSVAAGAKEDLSGALLRDRLAEAGFTVREVMVVPDDATAIATAVRLWADAGDLDLIITTGGTGLGPRDVTPEAMDEVFDREAPGIMEAVRDHGQRRTPRAMLARGRAGVRGRTLIINLPGSRGAVADAMAALLPELPHACLMLRGAGHDEDPRGRS